MDFDWKNLVKTVAPTIATAFGGPLAGLGVKAVSAIILGKEDGTEEEIELALRNATPSDLLKLKEGDKKFRVDMKKLDVDLTKLDYEDAASARKRQIEVKDITPDALAYLLLLAFVGALFSLFWMDIPEGNVKLVYTMIGSLGTLTIAACAYFHGSSRGSARKDAMRNAGK